jgi:hypothetical protein
MIGRVWRGLTSPDDEEFFEDFLRNKILPGILRMQGYRGACVMRRDVAGGVEFLTLTLFESAEAVRPLAGEDQVLAVVPPNARGLLSSFDQASLQYTVLVHPD